MTKRFAFTLAEVLIALAIIGVVAAMTIPTFMANTAGAQFRTGFKKGITVLTQAASTNYATDDYDFGGTNAWYGNSDAATTAIAGTLSTGARFGFNTDDLPVTETANLDMVSNAKSLYHIFKNNLNLKNSNEVVNYAVGIPDPALDCAGSASIIIEPVGVGGERTATGKAADATGNTAVLDRATYTTNEQNQQVLTSSATLSVGGLASLCAGRALGENGVGGINQGRMFMLEDGMVFTYDPAQTACTESNPCYGYLDVNGEKGPNRVISCSPTSGDNHKGNNNAYIRGYGRNMTGGEADLLMASCTVDAKDISDIFPVLFYGSTVKPASLAAKAVYYSQKSNQKQQSTASSGNG